MFVLKNIGPVKIGYDIHRFSIGKELTKHQIKYFKKKNEYEELFKAGIIGDKKPDESIRSSANGQPGNIDEAGRSESGNDDSQQSESKRGNKGKIS